eukprot:TRINITY_DN5336_c2_g1_i1.p1 TRINITY_DN5336_c2_g1~~TRINITY_DN5336_c2_g1_i1.p1  ORF type:complete len:146 (-),score=0.68 TRINITY_DN5336_c2_g1_i1:1629-2066(-)
MLLNALISNSIFLSYKKILLNILIFASTILCMCCFLTIQNSAPWFIAGLIVVLFYISFNLASACRSQSTLEASLYLSCLAFILCTTSSSITPSLLIFFCNTILTNYQAKALNESLWYLLSFNSHRRFKSMHIPTKVAIFMHSVFV